MAETLTAKQQLFIQEYLIDLNATQAAIRAGYSKETARQVGSENLSKPVIQAAIQAAFSARSERTSISQDRVLTELARIGFADIRNVVTWAGSTIAIKPSAELLDDDAAIISEISETVNNAGGTIKVKTHDKIKALEMIGKHLGMWDKPDSQEKGEAPPLQISFEVRQPADSVTVTNAKPK